jgi:tetratricopeptide (TPR) repeat protein
MVINPLRVAFLLAPVLAAVACGNPAVQKQRHFERGNQYVVEKRDEFAVIEYANAVRLDPKFGQARWKLAETYERMNNMRAAYPEFIRAADALPGDRNAQIKATELLLLAGRFDDAKTRATAWLTKNPKDVDALTLRASAMAALKDPAAAIGEIEEALKIQPNDSRAFITLGAVRSLGGENADAEAAFRKAIGVEPSAVNAHLAFANFLWSIGRQAEAEQEMKQAVSIEPRNLLANRMLGAFLMATNRSAEAEQPLKVVADVSGDSNARFQLAEYYFTVGRNEDLLKLLKELAAVPATAARAEALLASLDYTQGRVAEAHARLDKSIAGNPKDALALELKARWLAGEKKLDEALERAKAAAFADPQSASAQYTLGMVHDLRREVPAAITAYTEALRLNPRSAEAQIALSRNNLAVGNNDAAVRYAAEARELQPGSLAARLILVSSLLARGDLTRADTEVAVLLRGAPNSATVHALNGALQSRHSNLAAARKSYERSLELSPGNFEALAGLVDLEILSKQPKAAVDRLEALLAKQPDNADVLAFAGRTYIQVGQREKAEQVLRRAVTVDPRFAAAYGTLAQLYVQEQRLNEARAEFEGMVKRDPRAVGPRTVVGIILETQGKRNEARRWYEDTVAQISNAPVVANNLAMMYAEDGTNLDTALQLASSAKQQLPDSPVIDDTLGWIYYKKGLATLALRPLEDSLKKRPDNPDVLYHLGLAYAKAGEKAKARDALNRALKINPQLVGAVSARQTLASLSE